jgi:hypothetical protein
VLSTEKKPSGSTQLYHLKHKFYVLIGPPLKTKQQQQQQKHFIFLIQWFSTGDDYSTQGDP